VKRLSDLLPLRDTLTPAPAPAAEASTARSIRRREVPAAVSALPDEPPLLQRIYGARGIADPSQLRLTLDRLLPVGSLEGVESEAELLVRHREGRILVVGDFDADGATSTALMLRALRAWGFKDAGFLVPDRFRFGYGLTPEIVEFAAQRQPSLIVTVDNGISSAAGVARAKALGMAVLVTDHHLPGAELPAADVIVNPNLPGSRFGSRALAGVGVAFYVMVALRRLLQAHGLLPADAMPATELLDLVALGTVADLVPLDANNRVLVAQGLRRIRDGRCVPGIRALLELAGRVPAGITAADLGFAVAPRLNAAGRLDDMSIGIACLLATDLGSARTEAARLDELNRMRRQIEADMQALALVAVKDIDLPRRGPRRHGLCLFDEAWHQGVVGLVASRVKERVRRPVIAFARAEDGSLRGSARSVPGVHVRDVLEAVATREPDLIARFGGHAMAAGLTIAADALDRFARAFDAEVRRWTAQEPLDDAILTDGALEEVQFSLETAQQLREAGPWGQAFPEPSFDGEFNVLRARVVGERHVKLQVRPDASRAAFDAIAFNYLDDETVKPPEGRIRLVYRLDVNEYRGERRLQLLIEHLQPL
jgi:single-stranded-DNA-specific exonuclease